MTGVYFDHNATTPLDLRVREAMLPWLGEVWGNPASAHAFGQAAREAVEAARTRVAGLLGGRPPEVLFTASGTEANNAVIGSATRAVSATGHLVVSGLEHPSVTAAAARAATHGVEVTTVPPGGDGRIDPGEMLAAIRPETDLVCLMLANNEVGTIQPVAEVAAGCRELDVPLLCDAVQAAGKLPVDVQALGADYVSLAGHKLNGPLGGAALWVRKGAPFSALLVGGRQERRRRGGTVDVPAVVGLGRAAELVAAELAGRREAMTALRDRFEAGAEKIPGTIVHGAATARLPNTSHLAFPGAEAQSLMIRLDLAGFAVSLGAACASGAVEPSPVLAAMGVEPAEIRASLRLSFGVSNTAAEVDALLPVLAREVAELRRLAGERGGR